ncbi:MAG TPA: hypothetical protein VIL36_10730 [Acidimicrobiales bacterium]
MRAVHLLGGEDGHHPEGHPAGLRRGDAHRPHLEGYLDLQRQVVDPRIRRSTPYTRRLFVHRYRVHEPAELDDEFAGWLAEAYAVGQGAHLAP